MLGQPRKPLQLLSLPLLHLGFQLNRLQLLLQVEGSLAILGRPLILLIQVPSQFLDQLRVRHRFLYIIPNRHQFFILLILIILASRNEGSKLIRLYERSLNPFFEFGLPLRRFYRVQFLSFLRLLESQGSDLEFVASLSLLIWRLSLSLSVEPVARLVSRLQRAQTLRPLLHLGIVELASSQKLEQPIPRLEQPAGVADVEVEELVDGRVGQSWRLPPLHLVVVEEEGVIALLEEDEAIEEALLQEAVICIQAQQHLHTFVRNGLMIFAVLSM